MSELVKVRLFMDCTYCRGANVLFPCEVVAPVMRAKGGDWLIAKPSINELSNAGFNMEGLDVDFVSFYVGTECEIIND